MVAVIRPGWSKPRSILFASEIPANKMVFALALAQAVEFGAELILFHAYDTLGASASETSRTRSFDYASAAHFELQHLEPQAQQVREVGVPCEIVVRPGLAADQILTFLGQREVDRVVMGAHSPGPIGKLLFGSVSEAVLRTAKVPVYIVGPNAVGGACHNFTPRTILCAVSLLETSYLVVQFAAELAAQHHARLILQHVIWPKERAEVFANPSINRTKSDLASMVPAKIRGKIVFETVVVSGDPTEEVLHQGLARRADLILLGARSASIFASISQQGVVYKVVAHARCPVITLHLT
jgi:nucleotide-binding universal stress UspA family protein